MKEKEKDFRDRNLVFIDTETTGLSVALSEIIEVGCLVVNGRSYEVLDSYESKVSPKHIETADPVALEVNGYSPKDWEGAPGPEEVFLKLANIAPNGVLVGWNIAYDWSLLEKGFEDYKIIPKFDYHKIDAMGVAYTKLYKMEIFPGLALRKVAPLFGIKLGNRHTAMEDARATYEIFKSVMGKELVQESLI